MGIRSGRSSVTVRAVTRATVIGYFIARVLDRVAYRVSGYQSGSKYVNSMTLLYRVGGILTSGKPKRRCSVVESLEMGHQSNLKKLKRQTKPTKLFRIVKLMQDKLTKLNVKY